MSCIKSGTKKLKLLDQGAYTKVYKVNDERALKVIEYDIDQGVEGCFMREIEVLTVIRHPNLPQIYDVRISPDHIEIEMELMEKRLDKIFLKLPKILVEKFIWQLLNIVDHLHRHDIIHRDIALKNLMTKGTDLYLIDFNLSKKTLGLKESPRIVSLDYRAPEVVTFKNVSYDGKAVDMWSVGCIIFELMSKRKLFHVEDERDLLRKHAIFFKISRQFVKKYPLACQLLQKDPSKRLTARQALEFMNYPILEYPTYSFYFIDNDIFEFHEYIQHDFVRKVANHIYSKTIDIQSESIDRLLHIIACVDLACKATLVKYHNFKFYKKKFSIDVDDLFQLELKILKHLNFQILF